MAMDYATMRQPHIVLVEGKDEVNFFEALCKHLRLDNIQTIAVGGKLNFRFWIELLTTSPGFDRVRAIGLVRDADGNPRGAFDSLCSSLKNAQLPVPDAPLATTDSNPRVTILIMPPEDVGTGRMLEDLCFASTHEHPAHECVEQYLDCLAGVECLPDESALAKARVHAFLAACGEPDLRLGEAAQKGYWDWDSPLFEGVKAFLRLVTRQA